MKRIGISGFAIALALTGCSFATESGSSLVASVSASGVIASPGRHVDVTVTIVNNGKREANTADPLSYCGFNVFRVFDADGDEVDVPPPNVYCTLALYGPVTLAPGESVAVSGQWILPADLASGTYRLAPRVVGEDNEIPGLPAFVTIQQ